MSFRSEVSKEVKWRERRRGVRLNSAVPVAIEWSDAAGAPKRLEAKTRIVSPYGCLVVLPESLALDQPVELINLATQQKCAAAVVWKGKERVEGFEHGIEMLSPEMDFWGLDL